MASFDDLWDTSRHFRELFLYNKIFKSLKGISDEDFARAEVFWDVRSPKLDWHLCPFPDCINLVVQDDYCMVHARKSGKLPAYKWMKGVLFKQITVPIKVSSEYLGRDPQYVNNARHAAEKVFGRIEPGYMVHFVDGNPFNHQWDNLALLSKIVSGILSVEKISLDDAMKLDDMLRGFVKGCCGAGRPKNRWVYGYSEIAEAAGKNIEWIEVAAFRGILDPSKLASIVDFCVNCSKTV